MNDKIDPKEDEKLNVLHIIRSIDIGGIETQLLDFCNNAHRFNINTHVICTGGGELEDEFRNSAAKFNMFSKISRPYDLIDPFLVFKIRKYIKQNEIQIVHAHFADEGLHTLAAIIGLKKVKFIQGLAVDFRLNRKIDNRKFRFLCKKAAKNIALTEVLRKQTIEFTSVGSEKVKVVHNGIDPARVVLMKPSEFREELEINSDMIVGGMIGNFYNQVRNQLEVCKALVDVIKMNENFHFVFAGGDKNQWVKSEKSYFQECVEYCKNMGIDKNVHFLGLRKDIHHIMKAMDFYVHSTNYDTFGIAPIEAAMNKLPVIANDHPVFIETSHTGVGMLLYKTGDIKKLSKIINQFVKNENYRKSMGEKHHKHAVEHFHIDSQIRRMKNVYTKTLEGK
ncbi:MAG: glycosyltransferase family 1 protein [Chitinophagaceae bacterium]|nr:MAG: glycosyltransferase family 1 protein [Chitinophagaceae bacterium]